MSLDQWDGVMYVGVECTWCL